MTRSYILYEYNVKSDTKCDSTRIVNMATSQSVCCLINLTGAHANHTTVTALSGITSAIKAANSVRILTGAKTNKTTVKEFLTYLSLRLKVAALPSPKKRFCKLDFTERKLVT